MYARIPLSTGRREEVFRLLQEAGADESGLANVDLVWAARNLDRETLMSALERGADVNFVDSLADTALRRATISFSEAPERAREIVEILLGQGADPNFCPIGKPAIFDVIEGGNVELAKIFVNHGADPSIEWYGESAFKYAMMRRQNEIVELFRSMGAVEGPVKHRGLVVRDGNFAAVLLNRGVEEVAAALAGEGEVFQGIQGKPVDCGAKALLVYQLQGHGWTVVEPAAGFSVNLRRAEDLSRTLACQAIHLGVSDTAGIVEYTLFESGERMEWLYWGPKRAATFLETFASGEWEWDFGSLKKKRKPSRKTDPQEVLHRFLKSQDAYYMGPASRGDGGTQTFFAGWSSRELVRADVVRLR